MTGTGTSDTIAPGIRSSLADLSTEGLDLIGLPEDQVRGLVHEHLDYFQMMVGPSRPTEEDDILVAVLRERRRHQNPA
jgi:hypothetical protein